MKKSKRKPHENPHGAEIRKARHAAGLTQKELAESMGCTTLFASGLEIDARPTNMRNAQKICKACKCSFTIDANGLQYNAAVEK